MLDIPYRNWMDFWHTWLTNVVETTLKNYLSFFLMRRAVQHQVFDVRCLQSIHCAGCTSLEHLSIRELTLSDTHELRAGIQVTCSSFSTLSSSPLSQNEYCDVVNPPTSLLHVLSLFKYAIIYLLLPSGKLPHAENSMTVLYHCFYGRRYYKIRTPSPDIHGKYIFKDI